MNGGLWFCAGVLATVGVELAAVGIGTFLDRAGRARDRGGIQ